MLKYDRPPIPEGFKERSENALTELEESITPANKPFKQYIWQDIKPHFTKVQYFKCGYCEIKDSSYGDLEHYRPKSEIQTLVAEGSEIMAYSRKIRGRKNPAITENGYWWLAYNWDNYLHSCDICNRSYKSALFPISTERPIRSHEKFTAQDPTKESIKIEKPLLLNPFEENFEPYSHFEYEQYGLMRPRENDRRGKETMRICGLGRHSLVQSRRDISNTVWTESLLFASYEIGSDKQRDAAIRLFVLGHESKAFAGMVRVIFQQNTFLNWSEFVSLIALEGWMEEAMRRV